MSKMTVAEAAEYFKVSKEAIHNRVRRGTLDCVVEHGTKYIIAGDTKSTPPQNSGGNDKYYSYIEQENSALKAKIAELEGETRSLREQREQMKKRRSSRSIKSAMTSSKMCCRWLLRSF